MNDKLIQNAIAGSREAFCELYAQYKDRLYRYALYRLGDPDDAEDAVSECVLAAWKGIGGLRSSDAFASWIFRILSACCAKHIRAEISTRGNLERIYREAYGGSGKSGAYAAAGDGIPDPASDGQQPPSLAVELYEALSQLSDSEREIVLMSVIGGLSSSEIAPLTGLTAGAVRSKLSRSLAKMRKFLS